MRTFAFVFALFNWLLLHYALAQKPLSASNTTTALQPSPLDTSLRTGGGAISSSSNGAITGQGSRRNGAPISNKTLIGWPNTFNSANQGSVTGRVVDLKLNDPLNNKRNRSRTLYRYPTKAGNVDSEDDDSIGLLPSWTAIPPNSEEEETKFATTPSYRLPARVGHGSADAGRAADGRGNVNQTSLPESSLRPPSSNRKKSSRDKFLELKAQSQLPEGKANRKPSSSQGLSMIQQLHHHINKATLNKNRPGDSPNNFYDPAPPIHILPVISNPSVPPMKVDGSPYNGGNVSQDDYLQYSSNESNSELPSSGVRPLQNGDFSGSFANQTEWSTKYTNERNIKDPLYKVKSRINMTNNSYATRVLKEHSKMDEQLGLKCTFDSVCAWTWTNNSTDSFHIETGENITIKNRTGMWPGPTADIYNNASGQFLHTSLTPDSEPQILRSPRFGMTRENCGLVMVLHQSAMSRSVIRIVIEPHYKQSASWVPAEIQGTDQRKWVWYEFRLGRISKEFNILLEIVRNKSDPRPRSHLSIDNLAMWDCFAENVDKGNCSATQVQCQANKVPVCINPERICDHFNECDGEEDERQNCDKIPFGGSCDFENGTCGWKNSGKAFMDWSRHTGSTPTEKTGPDHDHTTQHTMNTSGHYMYVNMNQHAPDTEKGRLTGFASNSVMNSVIFNPPPTVHSNQSSPYRNSCMVRFYVHQFGMNPGSINLSVVEIRDRENVTSTLWWSSRNLGPDWIRVTVQLPNVVNKYYLQFEARMGMRIYSDVAIDDFSLSPECFGLNIPAEHLNGYNYWDPRIGIMKHPHTAFETKPYLTLTTCSTRGVDGPSSTSCLAAYNQTANLNSSSAGGSKPEEMLKSSTIASAPVTVLEKPPYKGIQVWRVPSEGYYTIIAKGAGGGLGSGGVGSSRGAMVTTVLELHKDEAIHVLVGQSGEHACIKSMGLRDHGCDTSSATATSDISPPIAQVRNIEIADGAGGGGGGTFVFLLNSANIAVPLLVAGGGGGLGIGRYFESDLQHGRSMNMNESQLDTSGAAIGFTSNENVPGPGGGWRGTEFKLNNYSLGMSLLEGGRGGLPCYQRNGIYGQGGFGGGGGGCRRTGGGGGGYFGGDTAKNMTNGNGGGSFIGLTRAVPEFSSVYAGANSGSGSLIIIPAIEGCGCDYRCVALDEFRSLVACICPDGWRLSGENHTLCEPILTPKDIPLQSWIIFFAVVTVALIAALSGLIFMLYNRYQRKKQANLRRKMLLEQDLQLSRLRHTADDSALTNFNPNYGCDGILNGNVDVKSLPQVARESLRLVKALGQGAFGEVYQGLYRHRDGDAVEMPVAVKTLPEMSTGQAEADFLMEAAIMAKFNHPNIVHLIGVCFDRHPRFIVLELLAGGDLKNFLREGRSKPERPSPLTMKDLVFCALDVAKGCRYMESKRFIHRDIAARNCLLSSKGPGRVVKIADFGMARDIYRSDYYRKGGKAMLPIKWMPPEAFLDGIFTSKTDVWSIGVLLWEVFSLGLMPYTGLPNRDVMQLVTGGGRLDAPPGCPAVIYRIMADCWNPAPEERPTFSNLLDRLTTCTQDPEVMNAPLPNFFRPPSNERDQTIMRPPGNDDFCLQVPNSDYLIPLSGPRLTAEKLLSEATGVTLSESMPTYTSPRVTSPAIPNGDSGCWETSFMIPLSSSSSDHPLDTAGHRPSLEKLISLDTPQATPTAILPPVSFIDIGSASVQLAHPISDGVQAMDIIPPPITLDPSALQNSQVGYANVRMSSQTSLVPDQLNGGVDNVNGRVDNERERRNPSSPYMIHNYKENHSEISC